MLVRTSVGLLTLALVACAASADEEQADDSSAALSGANKNGANPNVGWRNGICKDDGTCNRGLTCRADLPAPSGEPTCWDEAPAERGQLNGECKTGWISGSYCNAGLVCKHRVCVAER